MSVVDDLCATCGHSEMMHSGASCSAWSGKCNCPGFAEPSSLRAELAEAKAAIARLTEENADALASAERVLRDIAAGPLYVRTSPLCVLLREYERRTPIVAAATALRDYDAQFAYPGDEWVSRREKLVRAVVTAVEEGQKS